MREENWLLFITNHLIFSTNKSLHYDIDGGKGLTQLVTFGYMSADRFQSISCSPTTAAQCTPDFKAFQ
jgi:acyl-CoA hydrolase